jgi:hypothetical protein
VTTNGRTDDGSADQQAARLIEAYREAAARGVERAFWLFLRDAPDAGYFGPMGCAVPMTRRTRPGAPTSRSASHRRH